MIGQSFFQMGLKEVGPAMAEPKKQNTQDRNGIHGFRELLDSAAGRDAADSGRLKASAKREARDRDPGGCDTPAFRKGAHPFKDAGQTVKPALKRNRTVFGNQDRVNMPEDKNTGRTADRKLNAMLRELAAVIGINPDELLKLIADLNITPDGLADGTGFVDAIQNPAGIVMPDNAAEKALSGIIRAVWNTAGKYAVGEGTGHPGADQEGKHVQGEASMPGEILAKNTDSLPVPHADTVRQENFDEVLREIEKRLEEILQKVQTGPQKSLEETEARIKAWIAGRISSNTAAAKNPVMEKEAGDTAKSIPDMDGAAEDAKENTGGQAGSGMKKSDQPFLKHAEQGDEPAADVRTTAGDTVTAFQDHTAVHTVLSQLHASERVHIGRMGLVDRNSQLPGMEVLSQVIEKAKVVLTEEKSEMVLHLKPDSLGKLSLRLVTENGIITAKFAAESHQVKEILETNMQLLKDSLEKQGLSVHGFSVSVSEDPSGGFDRRNRFEDTIWNGRPAAKKISPANSQIGTYTGWIGENESKAGIYGWDDRNIDLTA